MILARDFSKNPHLGGVELGINVLGALPLVGKVVAPLKLARIAGKGINGINSLNRVNRAIDTIPELVPLTRKATESVQNATSKVLQKKADDTASFLFKNDDVTGVLRGGVSQQQIETGIDAYKNANRFADIMNTNNAVMDTSEWWQDKVLDNVFNK